MVTYKSYGYINEMVVAGAVVWTGRRPVSQPASLAQTQESQSSDIKHDHDLFTAN